MIVYGSVVRSKFRTYAESAAVEIFKKICSKVLALLLSVQVIGPPELLRSTIDVECLQ